MIFFFIIKKKHQKYYFRFSFSSYSQRKRSAHERAREQFSAGEWSTGQKWADDAPKEDVNPNTVNLLSIGACGAFIHGLEDEFLGVIFSLPGFR